MDSELVIACHCEVHEKLYFYNPDGSSRPLDGETYVDPDECPDKTWDKIPSNSKQIIWGQSCPVYSAFRLGSKHSELEPILHESLRILKLGGVVVFPLSKKMKEEIKFYPAFDGFRINIKENDGLPINIGIEDSNIKKNSPFLIIYTKISKGGGKMDSELVIACHCEKHKKLYLYNPDGSSRPLEGETYVDPKACPDKTWDKIPSNSKQIIWGQHCPVYFAFTRNEDKQLKEILQECYRVLKPGGCVIFPAGGEGFELEDLKRRPEFEGFKLEIRPNDGLPVNIFHKPDGKPKKEITLLIIYTKIVKGGGKMRLKTIRRSHKPEKKWDALFETDKGKEKVVSFGAAGMSDYTKHKDKTRRARYLKRHGNMGESWNKPDTPGALSRWVLWNKPSFKASVADFKKRFKL